MDIGKTEGVQGMGRIEGKRIEKAQPTNPPTPAPVDKVEVSQAGQLISEVMSLPSVRVDRIAELKKAIESGAYQTDERLLGALNKFLAENPDVL